MRVIALVSDAYGGRGGIALYNRNFLKAVSAHPNTEKVVVLPRSVTYELGELPDNLTYITSAVGSKLKYLKECIKLSIFENRVDFIFCGHLHLLPFAYLLRLRHRCPVIPLTYGVEAWAPTARSIVNFFCGRLGAFISIRKLTAKRFTEWSGLEEAKFYYLPNCIDEAQYGVAPKRQDLCEKFGLENKKVIMTAGRMDLIEYPLHRKPINQRKGFDEVLEVLPELRAREPNVAYLIIGDGDDKSRLQKKAKDLSVDDIVVFAGYVPDEDKADYYRLADAFVMPGSNPLFDRYPFRFVFLEALACGVPVVGCQLLDESEVDDSDAKQLIIQVDPSDPEDLQRGILEALSIPKSLYPEIKDYYYSTFETKVHKIIDEVMSCHASNNVFRNT